LPKSANLISENRKIFFLRKIGEKKIRKMMYRKAKKDSEFEDEFVSVPANRKELNYIANRNKVCGFLFDSK
jgi:hypothetical protein